MRTLYTGRELGRESGLYYSRMRWYSVITSTFLSRDFLELKSGDINLYRYSFNNPNSNNDPTGCKSECWECELVYDKVDETVQCGNIRVYDPATGREYMWIEYGKFCFWDCCGEPVNTQGCPGCPDPSKGARSM
jgi:RHS repeat-associated protein